MKTNYNDELIKSVMNGIRKELEDAPPAPPKPSKPPKSDAEMLADAMKLIADQRELIAEMQKEIEKLKRGKRW